MRINSAILSMLLLSCIMLISCSSWKKASTSGNLNLKDLSAEQLQNALQNKRHDFEWWQAKAKIYANMSGDAYQLQGIIKMKKNELIWVSLRKLGFEVARIYITPDSVIALNRLERTLQIEKTSDFVAKYGFAPQFDALQDLILGNPLVLVQEFKPGEKNSALVVQHKDDFLQTVQRFSMPELLLTNLMLNHRTGQMSMNAVFSQYQVLKDNKYFSYLRTYEFNAGPDEQAKVEIQYADIQTNTPFDTQIEIPSRYERL